MKTYFLMALAGLLACAIAGHDFLGNDTADFSGLRARDREGPNDRINVDTSKPVGDRDHLKVFVTRTPQKLVRGK